VANTSTVNIKHFKFQPSPVSIATGDTVQWVNQDDMTHTVTADNGQFDSGPLNKNDTFSQTFTTAGTVNYHCNIHTGMKGAVTVS
jgi:plastocyanin